MGDSTSQADHVSPLNDQKDRDSINGTNARCIISFKFYDAFAIEIEHFNIKTINKIVDQIKGKPLKP